MLLARFVRRLVSTFALSADGIEDESAFEIKFAGGRFDSFWHLLENGLCSQGECAALITKNRGEENIHRPQNKVSRPSTNTNNSSADDSQ